MYTSSSNRPESSLTYRVRVIGEELRRWKGFWSAHAFRDPVLGWEPLLPDLSRELRALGGVRADELAADAVALDAFLGRWFPVAEWSRLEAVDRALPWVRPGLPRAMERDIPGRKLEQILSFIAASGSDGECPVIDWCAGKGHLGRAMAHVWGSDVVALERDASLIQSARRLAMRDRVAMRAECCDVMSDGVKAFLMADVHLAALHACGALHRRLMDVGVACGVRRISVAPCCFHLGGEGHRPRSSVGREEEPGLDPRDLRTAVQDVVTAGGHARRRREHLQVWQLGLDALLRELCGREMYTAAPGASAGELSGGFPDYCRGVARRKGFTLPGNIDFNRWEQRGRERFNEVAALDLVRRRFRRLIEVWLVADLGVSLEEAGYSVLMARFCEPHVSPRNLLLQATRSAS